MNERLLIGRINAKYPVANGSRPSDITPEQLKAGYTVGRLLKHAHKRRKKWQGKWKI